ncbi:hypothetical protein BaRGS_00010773, partial [Batillaria attramentaria]
MRQTHDFLQQNRQTRKLTDKQPTAKRMLVQSPVNTADTATMTGGKMFEECSRFLENASELYLPKE